MPHGTQESQNAHLLECCRSLAVSWRSPTFDMDNVDIIMESGAVPFRTYTVLAMHWFCMRMRAILCIRIRVNPRPCVHDVARPFKVSIHPILWLERQKAPCSVGRTDGFSPICVCTNTLQLAPRPQRARVQGYLESHTRHHAFQHIAP